jgi:hypothetical protein
MNHQRLKSAVIKYGPLHVDGKSEAEVKEALVSDEKKYTDAEVSEIYAAIVSPTGGTDTSQDTGTQPNQSSADTSGTSESKASRKKAVYLVKMPFRDKDNFGILHTPGTDVSHFDGERLKSLSDKGLIEKQ